MKHIDDAALMESSVLLGYCIKAASRGIVTAVGSSTSLAENTASDEKLKQKEISNTIALSMLLHLGGE